MIWDQLMDITLISHYEESDAEFMGDCEHVEIMLDGVSSHEYQALNARELAFAYVDGVTDIVGMVVLNDLKVADVEV